MRYEKRFVRIDEAAKMLNIHPRTVINYIERGILREHRPTRGNRQIPILEIDRYCNDYMCNKRR